METREVIAAVAALLRGSDLKVLDKAALLIVDWACQTEGLPDLVMEVALKLKLGPEKLLPLICAFANEEASFKRQQTAEELVVFLRNYPGRKLESAVVMLLTSGWGKVGEALVHRLVKDAKTHMALLEGVLELLGRGTM